MSGFLPGTNVVSELTHQIISPISESRVGSKPQTPDSLYAGFLPFGKISREIEKLQPLKRAPIWKRASNLIGRE
jgi:hypothetical protein